MAIAEQIALPRKPTSEASACMKRAGDLGVHPGLGGRNPRQAAMRAVETREQLTRDGETWMSRVRRANISIEER